MGISFHRRHMSSYDSVGCTSYSCTDDVEHARFPSAQYKVVLQGYNPPTTPERNIWTMTITREVRLVSGTLQSAIEPVLASQVPSYEINAGTMYSESISP